MTKKMEDFFNLPPSEIDEVEVEPVVTKEQVMSDALEVYKAMSTAEKVDHSLPTVMGLESHDSEMDTIATQAVKTFNDLISLGGNVPDLHAGKIYEVAGQMLKTALDAKNSKADKKLRMIELQLKKIRAEQIDIDQGNGNRIGNNGVEFDRNELLRHIVSSKSENSDK
jgi:hypothetical protein